MSDLKKHLKKNFSLLEKVCLKYPDLIKIIPIEATYLAWLDCRGMNMSNKQLREFFINEAKLGLNAGLSFGREGSGFMRLNFAVSSAKMLEVIDSLEKAFKSYKIKG